MTADALIRVVAAHVKCAAATIAQLCKRCYVNKNKTTTKKIRDPARGADFKLMVWLERPGLGLGLGLGGRAPAPKFQAL